MSTPTAYVIRRNHTITEFDSSKIYTAIMKAFLAVEGDHASDSTRIHDTVMRLTASVTEALFAAAKAAALTHNDAALFAIEDIQNQVERQLMHSDYYNVAKAYILYREARHQEREEQSAALSSLPIIANSGERVVWTDAQLTSLFNELCKDLTDVDPNQLRESTMLTVFEWITEKEFYTAIIMIARTRIEVEPQYSYVAARVLLKLLQHEAISHLFTVKEADVCMQTPLSALEYTAYFTAYIKHAVAQKLLHPRMLELYGDDLVTLGDALRPQRDLSFTYLGLQTLYDRYFIHEGDIRIELPQAFFMRVAMGLSLNEPDPVSSAIEFYHVLSQFDYMTSTPTLFNSGTLRPQLSSCFLSTVPDDLDSIYGAIKDNALLSKYAGGLGNDWTPVRALGSHITGTNGKSQGVVPFLKVVNDSAIAVNQGGKRLGAACVYLETWHLDIEEFLELKKNTGDERRRTHDINTANWIPDLFMQRVMDEDLWTLFSPSDVPDLHDLYGVEFKIRYRHYESLAEQGRLTHKRIPAVQLWRKMLTMLYETGHPWITFKDPCNIRYTNQHIGVVHSSNLCVAPETLVLTDQGHLTISTLVDQRVNVWNGQEYSAVEVRCTGKNQKLLHVFFSGDLDLHCTPYHLFYITRPDDPMRLIEKRAHELEPGDRLSRFDSTSEEGMVEVLEVRDEGRYDDTYCFTEPKRHRGVFNHVLTGQCTEITLHTNAEEIAVCNLGSINLVKHLSADGSIDYAKLAKTTKLAVRMLDNVIDINYYSVDKARHSNLQHRPIGLGIMGFQDALYLRKTSYSSFNAVTFADQVMSFISYNAIHASCELALERGVYSSYEGSLWSQGILPIHSQLLLEEARIETCGKSSCRFNDDVVESLDLDWEALASKVCHQGMRNSNVLAIAPTATISNICGVSQSIEPTYQNLFVKSNLSGEFTVINPYLVADLKAIGLWDDVMLNDLKHYDGSVQSIERIPETLKAIYLTAFEHDQYWLISAAAARQKWIDQAQSLNLYLVNPKGVELDALYRFAWLSGLKTTYYLRTMAATHVEKSTAMQHAITSPDVDDTPGVKMCLLDDPTCEACQ